MAFSHLLGPKLLKGGSVVDTNQALAGKGVVGLYFSANWCHNCQSFTPQLIERYKEVQAAGKSFEIVFVSSDKDADNFKGYYGEMPWLALGYDDTQYDGWERTVAQKTKLADNFLVAGVPFLVLLDKNMTVITKDGRAALSAPDAVANYPWIPPTVEEALGPTFVNAAGDSVSLKSLQDAGTHIGLYFAARWNPACKRFTPRLVDTYRKLKAQGAAFEVLLCSWDHDPVGFQQHLAEQPWLAVPFQQDRRRQQLLWSLFQGEGMPLLVVLEPGLGTVTAGGRKAVERDPEGREFPWRPKPYSDLEETLDIRDVATVIVLMEEAASHWSAVERALAQVARVALSGGATASGSEGSQADACSGGACRIGGSRGRRTGGGDSDDEDMQEDRGEPGGSSAVAMQFAVAKETGSTSKYVRRILQLGKPGPNAQLVLLDLGDKGSYHVHEGAVDEAAIKKTIQSFKDKSLKKSYLKGVAY